MGWNYVSIPKLQRCNRWRLGMDKYFHLTFYQTCDYLSMLGLKLNHVSKRGPRQPEPMLLLMTSCLPQGRISTNTPFQCWGMVENILYIYIYTYITFPNETQNAFERVVCKMVAILSRPKCFNWCTLYDGLLLFMELFWSTVGLRIRVYSTHWS